MNNAHAPRQGCGGAGGARGCRAIFISVKVLINGWWRNEIYYTNVLLLLVWAICVVIFVAQTQSYGRDAEARAAREAAAGRHRIITLTPKVE